jgi:hypothetical protein
MPHFQRGSFPLPISSAEFIYLFPPTTQDFIFIKIPLANYCIFLYIKIRFYERLCFNKRIAFIEEKEIMTVKQVAEYLQMDEHTSYTLARSGWVF